jgi:hypothetical protein
MILIGYKENGVCRIIRNLGSALFASNINSKVTISGTYSRCLCSAHGPVIFFALGLTTGAQIVICDPDLCNPSIVVDHAYLHNILIPHEMALLKKRKVLGDTDDLDPNVKLIVLSEGIFYSCYLKQGMVDVSDSFVAPPPFDDSAFFGTKGDSDKTGWDFLEQVAQVDMKGSAVETYPLIRIDDQRYVFEYKMTPTSPWEECSK